MARLGSEVTEGTPAPGASWDGEVGVGELHGGGEVGGTGRGVCCGSLEGMAQSDTSQSTESREPGATSSSKGIGMNVANVHPVLQSPACSPETNPRKALNHRDTHLTPGKRTCHFLQTKHLYYAPRAAAA